MAKKKQNKRNRRVIVNEMYFRAIQRKAFLLDDLTREGGVWVLGDELKAIEKIRKEWDKQEIDCLAGQEPYDEDPPTS